MLATIMHKDAWDLRVQEKRNALKAGRAVWYTYAEALDYLKLSGMVGYRVCAVRAPADDAILGPEHLEFDRDVMVELDV